MILDAAQEVFAEVGYEAGSIDAIGARLGISGPALYRHFARKQDILAALLSRAVDQALADIGEDDPAVPDTQRLRDLARRLAERAVAEQTVLALIQTEVAGLDDANRAHIAEARDRLLLRWARALRAHRPDVDADGARVRILAAFAVIGALSRTASVGMLATLILGLMDA